MIRTCARCYVVVSERQRCPCIVCGACTTDGGEAGAACGCHAPPGPPGDPGPPDPDAEQL